MRTVVAPHLQRGEEDMRDKSRIFVWHMRTATIVTAMSLLMAWRGNTAIAADMSGNSAEGASLQAASWLATVPYGAAKVVYAISGGLVGSLAWVITGGNTAVAKAVWSPSMTGNYIVQPQNLTGDKALHFVGDTSD